MEFRQVGERAVGAELAGRVRADVDLDAHEALVLDLGGAAGLRRGELRRRGKTT
jgi:hypothetical protein